MTSFCQYPVRPLASRPSTRSVRWIAPTPVLATEIALVIVPGTLGWWTQALAGSWIGASRLPLRWGH